MIHTHNKMKVKIITKEQATQMGLTNDPPALLSGRGQSGYLYGSVSGHTPTNLGTGNTTKKRDNRHHQFRINIKTHEKEILFETEEYKKIRKDNGIKD